MGKRLRKQEKVELLSGLAMFEACTKRDLAQIASTMVEAERPAGAYLTREGRDGGLMFIILDGTADVMSGADGGSQSGQVIGRLGAGDVVGELSLIDGRTRSASVVASSPVHVLELSADDFRRLVHRSPKFVKALLQALSMRIREVDALTS